MNKNKFFIVSLAILSLILLFACGNESDQSSTKGEDGFSEKEMTKENPTNEVFDESDDIYPDDSNSSQQEDSLSNYSAKEIEYARVWLEVVGNKQINTLNVAYISAGESVSDYEGQNVKYPENVVYLFTDQLARGHVTYSSNGDGSINRYDLPSRWPTPEDLKEERNQTPEEYSQNIIDNTEKILIAPGDDEEVIDIIKKLKIIDK